MGDDPWGNGAGDGLSPVPGRRENGRSGDRPPRERPPYPPVEPRDRRRPAPDGYGAPRPSGNYDEEWGDEDEWF